MSAGPSASDPIAYFFQLEQYGIKLGLENIRTLCEALGRPQDAFRSVIVAGTNGKGSVTAMVATALQAAGYRTARYTSPHLIRLEERFVVGGDSISTEALRCEASLVRDVIHALLGAGRLSAPPTFFEATTALALSWFRRTGSEMAVLEVGMGGRLDATNIVTPLAAVITSIDIDHAQFLGATIPEIACEKAGVIKSGTIVVTGETKPEALAVIEQACRDRRAKLIRAGEGVTVRAALHEGRTSVALTTPARAYEPMALALRGRHQIANALTAVRLLEELDAIGVKVPPAAIHWGLTAVEWPGRLELRSRGEHAVLLDAAHNPAGAAALAAYLAEVYPHGLPIVFGAARDKAIETMVGLLAPHATRLVCAAARSPRAEPAEQLAARARRIVRTVPVEWRPDARAALGRAWEHAPDACATGSIFLVGDLLGSLASRTDR